MTEHAARRWPRRATPPATMTEHATTDPVLGPRAPKPPDPENLDPWLTVAEIASELRVNPATVRLWVSKGTLPATRAGQRKLLIRHSDLERMLEVRTSQPLTPGWQPRAGPHPRDPKHHHFDDCRDVVTHTSEVGWTIAVAPDHSKTAARPRYVRLELGHGDPVDLTPAEAASLAGDLAQRAAKLIP